VTYGSSGAFIHDFIASSQNGLVSSTLAGRLQYWASLISAPYVVTLLGFYVGMKNKAIAPDTL
jgi:hypothetical protein